MKIKYTLLLLFVFFVSSSFGAKEINSSLKLVKEISLPNVKGRIDHIAVDIKGERIFVACHDNNTVEVIDLILSKHIYGISGLSEPQGIFFVPETGKFYITNGGNGRCDIFDGTSFKLTGSIKFSGDADNMRYDSTSRRLYVGYGDGGIGVIDVVNEKPLSNIKLTSHPEAFELEDGTERIFINLPEDKKIVIADIKAHAIEVNWQLKDAGNNFPMALDSLDHRLFIACRNPAKFLVLDTLSGKITNELAIDGDADDIFYDGQNKRLFISCGEGFVDVIEQKGLSNYSVAERIPTVKGARTSLFVPESGYYYLAVPAQASQEAKIQIYKINYKQ